MNHWMTTAGVALFLTSYVHVFMGGPEIYDPILASDLSEYLRAMSAVLWHAVTVVLLVFAAAAVWIAMRPNRDLALVLIAIQVGFAGLFLFYGQTQLGTLWIMPQWVIFLCVPFVMLIGLRRQP